MAGAADGHLSVYQSVGAVVRGARAGHRRVDHHEGHWRNVRQSMSVCTTLHPCTTPVVCVIRHNIYPYTARHYTITNDAALTTVLLHSAPHTALYYTLQREIERERDVLRIYFVYVVLDAALSCCAQRHSRRTLLFLFFVFSSTNRKRS
jgi:hypothetical protein